MAVTLISFLGKAQNGGDYREATYCFDHNRQITTTLFGIALSEVVKPGRLIILGTSGSMWDNFLLNLDLGEHKQFDLEQVAQIEEASRNNCVTAEMLSRFEQIISEKLEIETHLKLIPFGINEQEQLKILRVLSDDVHTEDNIVMDLTHGFRHLPMLGFLSCIYLSLVKKVCIEGIYYGALDMTTEGKTPVMRLDGLIQLMDWINALKLFDTTGQLSLVQQLLSKAGVADDIVSKLKEGSFFENTLDMTKARYAIKEFHKKMPRPLPGIAELFTENLDKRTDWANKPSLYRMQKERAWFYLQNGDYVRAVALGFEAFISSVILSVNQAGTHRFVVEDYSDRDLIKDILNGYNNDYNIDLPQQKINDYHVLRQLRNALVHSNRSKQPQIKRIMDNEQELQKTLTQVFKHLLGAVTHPVNNISTNKYTTNP